MLTAPGSSSDLACKSQKVINNELTAYYQLTDSLRLHTPALKRQRTKGPFDWLFQQNCTDHIEHSDCCSTQAQL